MWPQAVFLNNFRAKLLNIMQQQHILTSETIKRLPWLGGREGGVSQGGFIRFDLVFRHLGFIAYFISFIIVGSLLFGPFFFIFESESSCLGFIFALCEGELPASPGC